jgi:hypothetical protein
MVAQSGVVFLVSMADILANPVEIFFGSFTATSTVPAVVTFPAITMDITTALVAIPVSDLASETHPPKPYDNVQGMERVISMMEDTLQIYERDQRSTQVASRRGTFPFGLRPPSDVYARQATKTSQIQSGSRLSSRDLNTRTRAPCDPLDVPCTYHKGAQHTLHGYRLRKKIDRERESASRPLSNFGDNVNHNLGGLTF